MRSGVRLGIGKILPASVTMKKHFERMGRFGKPDAHLYEVVYTLDRTANRK